MQVHEYGDKPNGIATWMVEVTTQGRKVHGVSRFDRSQLVPIGRRLTFAQQIDSSQDERRAHS